MCKQEADSEREAQVIMASMKVSAGMTSRGELGFIVMDYKSDSRTNKQSVHMLSDKNRVTCSHMVLECVSISRG